MSNNSRRSLTMAIAHRMGTTEIRMSGVITELSTMPTTELLAEGRTAIIDAAGVQAINSFGVRTWLSFLNAVAGRYREISLRRLSPAVIRQASMIDGFVGHGKIESYYTPWHCGTCEEPELVLHLITDEVPQAAACSECNRSMEFDDVRDSYLAFKTR